MALSPTAARALEQVKMGLFMLRGADYFTEDEWIKIDGLIHKGKYVFTNGPQRSNVVDEALITFDDTNTAEKQDVHVQIQPMTSFSTIEEETATPSPTLSDPADSTEAETPNTTSAEVSSDDEPSVPASADSKSDSNSQSANTSADTPKREPVEKPANGGLAFYTQAQLDEVKAFNSGLTKAGQKQDKKGSRVKRSLRAEDAYPSPAFSQKEVSEPTANPSPAPTEQDTRSQIQSWADEVQDTADATPAPEIAAPAPTKGWTATPPAEVNPLVEAFKKEKGRNPKNMNEVIQPKNLEFRPLTARPFSRVSHRPSGKSATPVTTPIPNAPLGPTGPKLNVKPGTVLVAQRDSAKTSIVRIAITAGDQIKVLKHVSGVFHTGMNLRTKEKGQFNEEIFKRVPNVTTADDLIQRQRDMAARSASGTVGMVPVATAQGRTMSVSTISNGLDRLEGTNAAEWDEVGSLTNVKTTMSMVLESKTSAPATQAEVAKSIGGLGASRFAALADEDGSVNSGSDTPDFQGMSKEEVGQLIDEKIAQILAAQAQRQTSTSTPTPTRLGRRSKAPINEPLKKITPKTETCWFWKTGKGCRFTADECRDLHAHLPSSDPTNLRMGKPSWGALADFAPPSSSTTVPVSASVQSDETAPGPSGQANIGPVKSLTCWYWQNDEKGCQNSAEDCKYLHKKCEGGVANRPNSWKKMSWNRFATSTTTGEKATGCAWTINGDAETDAGVDGELVLEEVKESESADAWGVSSSLAGWGGDDRYKPPHIKALEEIALVEAVGW
ncbi:uncharacterized protein PAC_13946 [Phialocephala subalpina]|uniref:C3H1-type domain-containing protein n=1 Tax=Phialocephala subalpina TaxID=576137 RepID=A0A1L7XG71_9HELO|nr:uncharacterized protein PAC_13946 [Phialocephala subalpina]